MRVSLTKKEIELSWWRGLIKLFSDVMNPIWICKSLVVLSSDTHSYNIEFSRPHHGLKIKKKKKPGDCETAIAIRPKERIDQIQISDVWRFWQGYAPMNIRPIKYFNGLISTVLLYFKLFPMFVFISSWIRQIYFGHEC